MASNERILVTGASGHLGQLVLENLLKSGQKDLIGTTRSPDKLAHLTQKGVEIRAADFNNISSLVEAFRGATRLLLISTADIGQRIEQHKNAIDAAKKAGVKHIFYTSWPNTERSPALVAPDHAATENFIKESGLKYTFLRNNPYTQNLFYSLPNAIESGKLFGCAGDGKVSYVMREDCAAAAAGALINAEKYENTYFDITGPKAYSYPELLNVLNEVTGKKVTYIDISPEDFKAGAISSGLPELYAQLFVSFDLAAKQGDSGLVTDAVQKLSGKPAADIHAFLKANFSSKVL